MTAAARIAFLGTSQYAAAALQRLVEAPGIEIACVVTQPDRQSGRGRKLQSPPIAATAAALGIDLVQSADASAAPPDVDAAAVVAFGQLIRPPLLGAYPLVNLHPSLLPRWRGAAPLERAILAGDTRTGVCAIELVQELDAGPVHGCAEFPIGPQDDAGALAERSLELGVPLLAAALRGETQAVPQATAGVTYAHKLTAADRGIDWAADACTVDRQVRALSPAIGARTEIDGRPVTVWAGRPLDGAHSEPGVITAELTVACGKGAYTVTELQPAGKRRMAAGEFLRGLQQPPRQAS